MPVVDQAVTISVPHGSTTEHRVYCNGNTYDDARNYSDPVQIRRLFKDWNRTTNYRALVRAKARLPDLGFTYLRWEKSQSQIVYRWEVHNDCSGLGGWSTRDAYYTRQLSPALYVGFEGAQTLSDTNIKARILDKARGAEFNAPVFFAEARKTGDMILGFAQTVTSTYRNLRRGRLVEAMRALGLGPPTRAERRSFDRQFGRDARRAASNRWLELQYGWTPLFLEVHSAAETLAEINLSSEMTVGRVSAVDRLQTARQETVLIEVSPVGYARRSYSQNEERRMVWRFEPTGLNNIGSLGLLNPLGVAWELVPLSFVVDWFLPVGRYLEQLDTPWRFNHVGGTSGYARHTQTTWDQFVRDGISGEGDYTMSHLTVTRSPLSAPPSLGLGSIWWDPNLGSRRVLSGLALASQQMRR